MSNEKQEPFSDDRWNDTSKPKIIGYREVPEDQRNERKQQLRDHLKKIGIINED